MFYYSILYKDKTFSEILKIFQNKYIEIRKMLAKILALSSCISTIHVVGKSLYLLSYEIGHKDGT